MKKTTIPVYGDSLVSGFPGYPFIRKLQQMNPDVRFLNRGRTGDTLFSFLNRIRFLPFAPGETAVLFIGINDIYVRYAWQFKPVKCLNGQWWVRDWESYSRFYKRILDRITARYKRVIVIPPLFMGEDPASPASRDLDTVETIIRELIQGRPQVVYPEIRRQMMDQIRKAENPNPAIANSLFRLITDVFRTRDPEKADRLCASRGYLLTTDGVHLSGRGAELVAALITEAIQQKIPLSRKE
jgi:lysophospholipase L1-like esterase